MVSFIGRVAPRGGGTLVLSGSPRLLIEQERRLSADQRRGPGSKPGDMVFCHPVMLHCAAPNRGAWPRFMRIKQQFLTHEGRDRFRGLVRGLA